ncbi:MAG: hypothetical protein GXP62_04900, partial [Oligoflexia bacterium]|nr:hypothetical protein [Oligoflexia bacterium]
LGVQYLGPILVGLAGVGLVRRWRKGWPLALAALTGLVLAMGTRPTYAGQDLDIPLLADAVLPYAWLQWLLSVTAITPHYPSRFIVLTVIALAGLAALALADITRPSLRALAIGLVALAIVDVGERTTQGWPWPVAIRPPVTGLATLAAEDPGAVVDLAYFSTRDLDARNRTAWYQTAYGLPTQAVAISQLDELNIEGAATVLAVPLILDLRQLRSTGATMKPNQDYQADLALLRADGFRWLMTYRGAQTDRLGQVTRSPTPPPRQLAALNNLLGIPFLQDDGFAVWHIPTVDVSASALAEAQRSRDARIEQVRDRVFERASPHEAPAN